MKLEFLSKGAAECPLIRLYEFAPEEVVRLTGIFDSLAKGTATEVVLNEESWVQVIGECELRLRLGKRNLGVVQGSRGIFQRVLDEEGWAEVTELSEPFCRSGTGFQWLTREGKVSWLLSPTGRW